MFVSTLLLALATATPVSTETIPRDTPVMLGVSLRFTHEDALAALRKEQNDPRSPGYHRWLTPREFGDRFGRSAEEYQQVQTWLSRAGLSTTTFPNRLFVQAVGTAEQVERLLLVQLAPVEGEAFAVHQPMNAPSLPPELRGVVLNVSGLDTRIRFRHHLVMPSGRASLGPQDLRRFYGLQPLMDQGYTGQGQKLVVLSTATPPGKGPSMSAINYFFANISDARALYIQRNMANPQGDYDTQPGANLEFELDVQMQSVGAPGADTITLQVAPASQVFTTGANDIVNNLPDTTAVSISLGLCEQGQLQNDMISGGDEINTLRQIVIQGTMQGQTWSAASGDTGANDCRNNTTVSVDFPSSLPEMVAAGGSSIPSPQWNAANALLAYQQEVTWNDGAQGGAAGGGLSVIFPRPAYQAGLTLAGTSRSVPDIALISGLPAVATASALPLGYMDPVEGTSVASPLSAGFFALIASAKGCRLGDVHEALYAMGGNQADGGTAVFHDITSGNLTISGVTGPSAGPGYDSATGWGSFNVAAMAANWPACPTLADGGSLATDSGVEAPYSPCAFAGCDGGCSTYPDGPSTCMQSCGTATSAACPAATVCSKQTIFSGGDGGMCIAGCLNNGDCASQPGTVCRTCSQTCVPGGNPTGYIGSGCSSDSQCPSGSYCSTSRTFTGGYCTQDCSLAAAGTSACSCPVGSVCGKIGRTFTSTVCLALCTTPGLECGRTGYVCQPQTLGTPSCLPKCAITTRGGQPFDSCAGLGTTKTCDVDSGVCGGPTPVVDAGPVDAGPPPDPDPVYVAAASNDLGALNPAGSGCSCAVTAPGQLLLGALGLLLLRRKKR